MQETLRVSSPSAPLEIERRPDGSLLVYVHSWDEDGMPLPDAVFTFAPGDPQYGRWDREFDEEARRLEAS
jgi:hypothetical protein